MLRIQVLLHVFLIALFIAPPLDLWSQEAKQESSRRTSPSSLALQAGSRDTKIPAADASDQVKPAAHFDTTGEDSSRSSRRSQTAAQRLRRMKSGKIFDDLPDANPPGGDDADSAEANPSPVLQQELDGGTLSDVEAIPADEVTLPQESALDTSRPVETVTVDDIPSVPNTVQSLADQATGESFPNWTGVDETEDYSVPTTLPSVMERSAIVQEIDQSAVGSADEFRFNDEQANPYRATPDQMELTPTPMVGLGDEGISPQAAADVLIANESPNLSVETRGPRTIVVGKSATYQLRLSNASNFGATDVIVRVKIPTWTDVVSQRTTNGDARVQPDESGHTVMEWHLDELGAGGTEVLALDVVPRSSRPFDLGVTWSSTPMRSSAQILVQEPKLDISVVGAQDVLYGETKVYTITVSNPGTGDAENVILHLLPLVPNEKSTAVRRLGMLKAGTRRTLDVELTARQTGRLQIRAEATADGGLAAQGHQEVFVRRAALEAHVEGPPVKYAGTKSRYTIRVVNSGDAVAREVLVAATLPNGATEVSSPNGGTMQDARGQVMWEVGSLRPGAARVMEFECTLTEAGNNRIDVRTVGAEDISAVASTVTNVESLADLKLTVNDPKGAVPVGMDVVYEVKVMNRGTKEAQNIAVVGFFSKGIEPVRISGWNGKVAEGQVTLDNISRLGPGQEMVITVTAQAQKAGSHVFRAELECNNPDTKLAQEEWTKFYSDTPAARQATRPTEPPQGRRVAPPQRIRR